MIIMGFTTNIEYSSYMFWCICVKYSEPTLLCSIVQYSAIANEIIINVEMWLNR